MADDLVAILREWSDMDCAPCPTSLGGRSLGHEAADRIQALEREIGAARDAVRLCAEHAGRLEALERVVRELVALDDLQERIDSWNHDKEGCLVRPYAECPENLMRQDYERRKPLAWKAARDVMEPK